MVVLRAAVVAATVGRDTPTPAESNAAWEALYEDLERAGVSLDEVIGEAIRLVSLALRARGTFLRTGTRRRLAAALKPGPMSDVPLPSITSHRASHRRHCTRRPPGRLSAIVVVAGCPRRAASGL